MIDVSEMMRLYDYKWFDTETLVWWDMFRDAHLWDGKPCSSVRAKLIVKFTQMPEMNGPLLSWVLEVDGLKPEIPRRSDRKSSKFYLFCSVYLAPTHTANDHRIYIFTVGGPI